MTKRRTFTTQLSQLTLGKQILLSILCILLIVLMVLYTFKAIDKPEIVVYDLEGAIMSSGQGYITPKQVHSIVEEINNSKNIKAAVLFINSPGGGVWASEEIANEISKIDKPVVACLGETATSGGYYIACYCDKIVTYPTTLTGSIGVIMEVINMSELLDKIGIKFDTYSLGKYKDIYNGTRSLTDDEKSVIDTTVTVMYTHFVNVVAINRHLSPYYVRNLATGQIYTGYEAVQLRLADKLGTCDDAIALAAELSGANKTKVDDRRYRTSFFGSLFGKVGNIVDLIITIPDSTTRVEFQYR